MGFWTAWQFLTILPSPGGHRPGAERLGSAVGSFPLVGLILGAILLGVDQLLGLFLPSLLVGALLVVSLVVLTGALHLDGFMDTCDGFALRSSAADRLRVMSDSRVGGFGVAGACCLVLLKYVSLITLPEGLRAGALLVMPALSRWGVTWPILVFPSARKDGLGQMFKETTGWPSMALATVTAVAVAAAFFGAFGAVLLAGICGVGFATAAVLSSRLGGLTGDTYGAIIELSEVVVLMLVIMVGKVGGTSWLGSYL